MLNISAKRLNTPVRTDNIQRNRGPNRTDRASRSASVSNASADFEADLEKDHAFVEAAFGSSSDPDDQGGGNEHKFEDFLNRLVANAEALDSSGDSREIDEQSDKATEMVLHASQAARQSGGVGRLNQKTLAGILRQVSGGSSQRGLMIMKAMLKKTSTDSSLKDAGIDEESLLDYAAENEAGITAAVNVSDALSKAPKQASESADRILNLYEQSVVSSQGVLQTFQRLGKSEGIGKISDWKKFLTEAVASDLSTQRSSTDKNKLQLILQELKGFRLFNTLVAGLERVGKYITQANETKLSEEKSSNVLQTTLDYIEQPIREFPTVQSWVSHKDTQNQILFFQGYRNLLKSMPDDAYVNPEQKNNSLVGLQKKIDDLTYAEDYE